MLNYLQTKIVGTYIPLYYKSSIPSWGKEATLEELQIHEYTWSNSMFFFDVFKTSMSALDNRKFQPI